MAGDAARTIDAWRGVDLPQGFREVAVLACLCHDAGKATPWFQAMLDGGPRSVLSRHSQVSACIASHVVGGWQGTDAPERGALLHVATVAAVLRHHGPLGAVLKDVEDLFLHARDVDPREPLAEQWEAFDWLGFGSWIGSAARRLGVPRVDIGPRPSQLADLFPRRFRRILRRFESEPSDAVSVQLVYSLVIGCDKLDAAFEGDTPTVERAHLPGEAVERFRVAHFGADDASAATPSEANRLRREVATDVATTLAGARSARLFTLTAPTGSGKTLTALETALALASDGADEPSARIVYCLPYTSIIDQNHAVIEQVLAEAGFREPVLKHHHLAEVGWRGADDTELDPDRARLLTESWRSQVVVTTFVQLVESLLGRRNRMLKKLLQLPGAVVLLDEVQAIPRPLWDVVREALVSWSQRAGTRFVLLTATRPLIFRDGDAVELCAEREHHFARLDRVEMHCELAEPLTIESLAQRVLDRIERDRERRRLVICNTIGSARELFRRLQDGVQARQVRLVYLSTHLSPRDRLGRIRRLRAGDEPCCVVSTQLIEAGVDLSVDEVIRDLAPLDSIIQAAGRCNRSGERGRGRVEVLQLQDERGRKYGSWVYNAIALDATKHLLGTDGTYSEADFLRLGERYFQTMWDRTAPDEDLVPALGELDFERVGELRLIDDDCTTQDYLVIAPDDGEAEDVWEEYRRCRSRLPTPLKRALAERVISVRTREPADEPLLPLREYGDPRYDREVGYVVG